METAARALARHIVDKRFEALPRDVVREAKRRIAEVIGAGLSGSATPVGAHAKAFAMAHGGQGPARIWGLGTSCAPAYAAKVNGTMAFHLELDDVHRSSHTYPGVTTMRGSERETRSSSRNTSRSRPTRYPRSGRTRSGRQSRGSTRWRTSPD